ncbi:Tryptophan--tRNA ligase, mitochondrial [Agyrium rufum]|nr:Tryptophan--tRNA ligase, mitochondrial [Agyrium rufum]
MSLCNSYRPFQALSECLYRHTLVRSSLAPIQGGPPRAQRHPASNTVRKVRFSTRSQLQQAEVRDEKANESSTSPQSSGIVTSSSNAQKSQSQSVEPSEQESDAELRLPRSVQAVYLRPLRRHAKHGIPCCDLQLRSYSVRNLEFFADFALRAAYYLNLPAAGPIPLPKIVQRWTVPRDAFVHKKSQENFERITMRRLIQISDGHPETVQLWLAFLRKHAYYGVGMKANVWEFEKIGVGKTMDVSLENLREVLEPKWAHFGRKKTLGTSEKVMEMLNSDRFRNTSDGPFSRLE